MKAGNGYLKESKEQGRSGLGLVAQRHDTEVFGTREGLSIKNAGIRTFRQGQAKMRCCCTWAGGNSERARAASFLLIVSRLDRMSRNVHVIPDIMEHKVNYSVAALIRECDEFTLRATHSRLARRARVEDDLGAHQGRSRRRQV